MPNNKEVHTVSDVVKERLCTSCGICAGACNKQSIFFQYGYERNTPVVDTNTCNNCGICYEVCPGKGLPLYGMAEEFFAKEDNVRKEACVGYYLNAFVGHSTDEKTRYHCATGGMVTQFLTWLLQNKVIDGAVVVRYRKDNPFEPEPFIATTPEEIWESRSSKYVVLSMDKVANEIAHGAYKNLVVVGLPCMIQGWRLLAKSNKKVREAIKGYFAIYCSVNKTKRSLDYYSNKYGVDKNKIGRFTFRDDGCMGYMKFEDEEGNVLKKVPYLNYWFGTHSFFVNPRCLACIDQLGDLADISFGDIHIAPYSEDIIGTNSILTRSSYWDCLLRKCKEDGCIALDEIPVETLLRSQIYAKTYKKGAGAKAYMILSRLIGRGVPFYDYEYVENISVKEYASAIGKLLMCSVGKRKWLWWLIKMLDGKS